MAFALRAYSVASTKWPHLVAGSTSCFVTWIQPSREGYDFRRTLGLSLFGMVYYGGPCKLLYLGLDRYLGTAATLRSVVTKTTIDVFAHTPVLLVPTFYLITNSVKGVALDDTVGQLKREWGTASFGSVLFWTPAQLVNFALVPQPFKMVFISSLSFVHKTWLSYLSNKERYEHTKHKTSAADLRRTLAGPLVDDKLRPSRPSQTILAISGPSTRLAVSALD